MHLLGQRLRIDNLRSRNAYSGGTNCWIRTIWKGRESRVGRQYRKLLLRIRSATDGCGATVRRGGHTEARRRCTQHARHAREHKLLHKLRVHHHGLQKHCLLLLLLLRLLLLLLRLLLLLLLRLLLLLLLRMLLRLLSLRLLLRLLLLRLVLQRVLLRLHMLLRLL